MKRFIAVILSIVLLLPLCGCQNKMGWSGLRRTVASSRSPLYRKNVVFLGDSIYGNNQSETGIANLFADLTGANVSNFAFGGTRATRRSVEEDWTKNENCWGALDGESIAECIASGDFSILKDAHSGSIEGAPGYFYRSIDAIQEYDWSKCDYIICNWGTNDWTGHVLPEDYSAAMDHIIETILSAYPQIVFVKCKATQRFHSLDDGSFISGTNNVFYRDDNVTLQPFADADDHLVGKYNIQVIDCLNIGINDFTRTHFFTADDWTHPNEYGRRRIAEYLAFEIH